MNPQKLIVILGPTAAGKTNLSIKLAKKYRGEIISADSRTIYEFMDIGTAKPTQEERAEIPHHLLNIKKPNEKFSLAEFQKLAYRKIQQILKKGKIPFLVGGTGLYIEAVCEGFQIPKPIADYKLRQKLSKKTGPELYKILKKADPKTAKKIDPQNKRRIIRALEVYYKIGKSFSELQKKSPPNYQILKIGLKIPRSKLYQKINQRTDEMIKAGLVEEVKNLLKKGYKFDSPALSGLIYQQIKDFLQNKISSKEAIEEAKKQTRHFAKRQLTWFKRDKTIYWVKNFKQADIKISKFLGGARS